MIRVSLLLVVLALAALGSVQTAAAEEPLVVVYGSQGRTTTLEVERPNLRCDGVDSTLVVAIRRRKNGDLDPGAMQRGIPSNTQVLNAAPEVDEYGSTWYRFDENAELILRVTPVNNGKGWWDLYMPVADPRSIGAHLPCPLTDDRTYTISGDVWSDDNRDGVRDAGEGALPDFGLKLHCQCGYDNVPWHYEQTTSEGAFEWTGLHHGGYSASSGMPWEMCVDEDADDPLAIVSVNGAPVEPTDCLTIRVAVPGDLPYSLGVAELSSMESTTTPTSALATQTPGTPQATATRSTPTASPTSAMPIDTETVTQTTASGSEGQSSTPAAAESSAEVASDVLTSDVLGTSYGNSSGVTLPATGAGDDPATNAGPDVRALVVAGVLLAAALAGVARARVRMR